MKARRDLRKMKDYYDILGATRNMTEADIRACYKQQALKLHPDKNSDTMANKQFQELQEAYTVLSNPELRKRYDAGESHNPQDNQTLSKVIFEVMIDMLKEYQTMSELHIHHTVTISLARAYQGGKVTFPIKKYVHDELVTDVEYVTLPARCTESRILVPAGGHVKGKYPPGNLFVKIKIGLPKNTELRAHSTSLDIHHILPITLRNVYGGLRKRIHFLGQPYLIVNDWDPPVVTSNECIVFVDMGLGKFGDLYLHLDIHLPPSPKKAIEQVQNPVRKESKGIDIITPDHVTDFGIPSADDVEPPSDTRRRQECCVQ